ncbi:zinc-type alcohol dehydrogenase-like protein [Acrasis kona]|uniref:Zinc-type alcohol dehydrogenase-like protein n=1 Tax=Acrasis kona TaxID=1008807 RepID=A0AAW2ZSJ6_9EUKA
MMKSVIFKGPHQVKVEQRSIPKLKSKTDVIVKVRYNAICGSDLHAFRGVEECESIDFIMGHEFCGTIYQVGESIKNFQVGDSVVSPFTVSCGECFYCLGNLSARCEQSLLFGSPRLDGGQAEYVRVPLADSTLLHLKNVQIKDEKTLLFLGDIFPTGYFCVKNALSRLNPKDDVSICVFGCGPVGLCTIIAAKYLLRNFGNGSKLFAVDSVQQRLEKATLLGATVIKLDESNPTMAVTKLQDETNGRGVDASLEVVGSRSALRIAFDSLRPFGVLSSVGVHNSNLPFSGDECFTKNIVMQFGRCPVRSILPESIAVMEATQDQFKDFVDHVCTIDDAVEAYDLFEKRLVQKVVFNMIGNE